MQFLNHLPAHTSHPTPSKLTKRKPYKDIMQLLIHMPAPTNPPTHLTHRTQHTLPSWRPSAGVSNIPSCVCQSSTCRRARSPLTYAPRVWRCNERLGRGAPTLRINCRRYKLRGLTNDFILFRGGIWLSGWLTG